MISRIHHVLPIQTDIRYPDFSSGNLSGCVRLSEVWLYDESCQTRAKFAVSEWLHLGGAICISPGDWIVHLDTSSVIWYPSDHRSPQINESLSCSETNEDVIVYRRDLSGWSLWDVRVWWTVWRGGGLCDVVVDCVMLWWTVWRDDGLCDVVMDCVTCWRTLWYIDSCFSSYAITHKQHKSWPPWQYLLEIPTTNARPSQENEREILVLNL